MGKFDKTREELLSFLSTVDGEDYDAVYFFIGERDFDRSDAETVGKVADYFMEKASSVEEYPYRNCNPITEGDRLYKDGEGAPEELRDVIERRRARIQEAEKDGMTYIPYSREFERWMNFSMAYGSMTEDEAEAHDYALKTGDYKYERPSGVRRPRNYSTFEVVLVIVVGILVLFSLITEGMY